MHEKSFTGLMDIALKPDLIDSLSVNSRIQTIAAENKEALPADVRTPTDEEMKSFREYIISYKKNHPKAKER